MTKQRACVAILALALASSPSLFAQQVIRLRFVASGVLLKGLPDRSLVANADSAGRPDSDENSHWIFEAIPGSDQFFIRHVGSGRYLTAGPVTASLEYSNGSAAQIWNIEPDPKYAVYRFSTQDGRYFNGAGLPIRLATRASISSADEWWGYTLQFDRIDGQPAPASVAMTANQIAAVNRRALEAANRAALVNAARAAQGCWREDLFNANPVFYVFALRGDGLVLYSLRFTPDLVTSREVILGGWSVVGALGGLFEPKNGNLTDESGATLTLDGGIATRIGPGYGNRLQRAGFAATSSARGITAEDCSRLQAFVSPHD
jgi:hypothetical protein